MFTMEEAKLHLFSAVEQAATYLIPFSTATNLIPPYTLRTDEYVPFPVTKSYHLGAMGRYPKADYIFDWGKLSGKRIDEVPRTFLTVIVESPRLKLFLYQHHGLREALELYFPQDPRIAMALSPVQGNAFSLQYGTQTSDTLTGNYDQDANGYILADRMEPSSMPAPDGCTDPESKILVKRYAFTFGQHCGKTFIEVPMSYLRSIEHQKPLMDKHHDLREEFARFFPQGCFWYEVEKYRFDFGKHATKRMHEVPEDYLSILETNMDQLSKNVVLQHALRERNNELYRSNEILNATIRKFNLKKKQGKT